MNIDKFQIPAPRVDPPSKEAIEQFANKSKKDHRQFKKTNAYKKYVKPHVDQEKSLRRSKHQKWWKNNWIGIVGLLIAIAELIVQLISA